MHHRVSSTLQLVGYNYDFEFFFFLSFFYFTFNVFLSLVPFGRGIAGLGFDVRTSNGRDQLQCLMVFYDRQDQQLLKVPDHYTSRHDLASSSVPLAQLMDITL